MTASPFGDGVGIGKEGLDALDDQKLELGCRQALPGVIIAPRSYLGVRDQSARDIVAIAHALLDCVGWRHRLAAGVEQDACQQISLSSFLAPGSPVDAVGFELPLNLSPEILINDRRMLAWIDGALVDDLAAIDPVLQHLVEGPAREGMAAIGAPVRPPSFPC